VNRKLKIIISYPPLKGEGTPLLSQNRQFQWFNSPTYIYPVVPASAATMLKEAGFNVIWNDCIAEGWSYERFLRFIQDEKPDLIAFETKTPVVKQHWKIIADIKKLLAVSHQLSAVLFGDHVTALPEESFKNSKVDYVLTGGDYDFLLANLCNWLEIASLAPGGLARNDVMARRPQADEAISVCKPKLEPGIYYRENNEIKNTGKFDLDHDLNSAPFIDRDLTKWKLYAYKNGNYKRTPGTYIMSGRDCWFHLCAFCSWRTLYTNYRVRKPELVANEIKFLIDNYNIKTIFDDTGTFPIGKWLREFCQILIDSGHNKKIDFSCNARLGSLSLADYKLMKKSGFRMLLFGLESANQKTLDAVNKGLTTDKIISSCKEAKKAGLEPHITIMFGYPWETRAEAERTFQLGKFLLKKGYADTLQATMVIPYPGTTLFNEANKEGWLKHLDWQRYDMSAPIMKTPMEDTEIMKMVHSTYKVAFNPEFIMRKVTNLRRLDDIKFVFRATWKVLGHLKDFGNQRGKRC
jgi:anaerobic magnesium-protoporphyrin IX monomethyl ester cyclase